MAITREVSAGIERCELTHLARTAIDVARARRQHEAYERALAAAGCTVRRLPAGDDLPDSVFVEDIAVVFDELAIVARPGAESRRAETPAVADALRQYRVLRSIDAPGTLDGGDVLVAGRRVFVGLSSRTNEAGIEQMRRHLQPYGYTVEGVSVSGCLHLKSAVTALDKDRLLINPDWVSASEFTAFDLVMVDPAEPLGANALPIRNTIVYAEAFPRTRRHFEVCGLKIVTVDVSETAKAEGGVTCCSLVFDV